MNTAAGASGFWIENGELAYPVSEITIAANLKDMFMNMVPANDVDPRPIRRPRRRCWWKE